MHSIDDSGTALRAAIKDVQLLQDPNTMDETPAEVSSQGESNAQALAPDKSSIAPTCETTVDAAVAAPQYIDLSQTPQVRHATSLGREQNRLASPRTPLTPVSPPLSSASSNPAHRLEQLRSDSAGRISSPFQLSSPRFWTTPPSPRTVEVFPDQPTVPTPLEEPTPVDGSPQ